MDYSWNAAQLDLRSEFADFGRHEVAPRALACAAANAFDAESWQKLAQTDFWKLPLPVSLGGSGRGWWDFTAAIEGLARTCSDGGFLMSVIGQAAFIRGILEMGTEAQQHAVLPELLAGGLCATAIAEPHTGTDARAVQTVAQRQGAGWVLEGEKRNIAHAPGADWLLVLGRMPDLGKRDATLFLLHGGAEGLQRGPANAKLGNRTLPTGWIRFEGVPVSEAEVLGKPGDGLRALGKVSNLMRAYYGLLAAQLALPLLDRAGQWLEQRESMGRGLLEQQHVQRKLVDAIAGVHSSRMTGLGAVSAVLAEKAEAGMLASVAKMAGTEALVRATQDLMTLMGSEGYQEGLAAHLHSDAAGWLLAGGTEEMHRINVFQQWRRLGAEGSFGE